MSRIDEASVSSTPVIAGMWTSAIRQAVSARRGDARKSASFVLEAALDAKAFSLRLVSQGSAQRNHKNIPHDQRAIDGGIPNRQIALD
jgi:hypothetical protein